MCFDFDSAIGFLHVLESELIHFFVVVVVILMKKRKRNVKNKQTNTINSFQRLPIREGSGNTMEESTAITVRSLTLKE